MPHNTIPPGRRQTNLPVVAVICTTVLLVVGVVAATTTGDEARLDLIFGLLLSTVPSFAALWYAERASRDIRNGTVTEKARVGTHQALEESGVTEVVEATQRGASTAIALDALRAVLEDRDKNTTGTHAREEGK
jgi:hypothetical protein